MSRSKLWLTVILFLALPAFESAAQKKTVKKPAQKTVAEKTAKPASKTPSDSTKDEAKVKDLIAFFQFMLNTLGSGSTNARDKEVMITQSYSKIFRDEKVQIEDDLDEDRATITNKEVMAYLKDVDFFFKDVKFEFTIDNIERKAMSGGQQYYKASLRRNLNGTTSDGKAINNTMPRFIEVNLNPTDQDLKIVSIYTNEFDEKEALTNWWNSLSFEWQTIFKRKYNIVDSVDLAAIKDIIAVGELDLSNNMYIQNIEPLGQLSNLQTLNLSYTNITDLTPIRNLTELTEINLSNTKITDLTSLKYANKIAKLNISNTSVSDIAIVEKMPALQNLEMSRTKISDFSPLTNLNDLLELNLKSTTISNLATLENLTKLTKLNISGTPVKDLKPLEGLANLDELNLDSTRVNDLGPLSKLINLKVLYANFTAINSLQPLQKLPHLEKVYCDQTPIKRDAADAFTAANPKALVVFDSKDLNQWWESLPASWQNVISKTAGINSNPSKEELAKIPGIDSINFSENNLIADLEPLRKLMKLRTINAGNTVITDLTPLTEHREVTHLDISDTEVSDISLLKQFTRLKFFKADRSKIQSIEPLINLAGIEKIYVDQTAINDIVAREYLDKNTDCLLVYKTFHLNRWWRNLPEGWQGVFRAQMKKDTSTTRENLHRLAELEILNFSSAPVSDLSALSEFVRLKELHFTGTSVAEIPALDNIRHLKSLHATNSPLRLIESLSLMTELEDLNISNTPVDELKVVGKLSNLKRLDCSGTQIKRLDPLGNLESLEYLDCSNTNVSKLDALDYLNLKTLKCYNTKISTRTVENFKASHPDCEVVYYR